MIANLYPEQLRGLAAVCEALNAAEKELDDLMLKSGIDVTDSNESVYGTLVDEIGGCWSFRPKDTSA